jgi:hypothetical protein
VSTKTHIVLVILTVGSIAFILHLVRRQVLRAKYALLWLSVGGLLALIAAVPWALDRLANWLGVSYQPALFLMLGLAFLLLLSVHFSWELSRLEDRVRTLAEEVALLRYESEAGDDHESTPETAA